MKALSYLHYGGPEVLQIIDIPKPIPREDQVLIRIKAFSLNDWDMALVRGKPYVNRTMAGNLFKPRNFIPGSDIAGIVEDTGRRVTRYKKGDLVFGDLSGSESWGGCAEYVCASEEELTPMGEDISFEEAAALPQAGMLALQALIELGNIKPGQSVLINGAGGGVGTLGLQIAKALGASYVAGVDRSDKLKMMSDLGFDKVLDYEKGEFLGEERKYDLIVDTKTFHAFYRYTHLLKRGGSYISVGGSSKKLMTILAFRGIIRFLTGRKFNVVLLKANRNLGYLKELYHQGSLRIIMDGPYPFEKIIDAFRHYSEGDHRGKVIVTVP